VKYTPLTEEEKKDIARKALEAQEKTKQEAWKDADKWEQVNDDGTPINLDKDTYRRTGEKEYTFKNGIKLDHSPKGPEKGMGNMQRDRYSKQLAGVSSKAAEKKRKSAQESMNRILSCASSKRVADRVLKNLQKDDELKQPIDDILPADMLQGLDNYDIVNLAMYIKATQGNDKAATYVRDTAGDKPTDKAQIDANVITDGDRILLAKLMQRRQKEKQEDEER